MTTELRPPDALPRLYVDVLEGRPIVRLSEGSAQVLSRNIPYDEARRLYSYINASRGAGLFVDRTDWRSARQFGYSFAKHRFRVRRSGVRVGCQTITYKDIAAFAALQGWPKLRAIPKKVKS